MGWIPTGGSLGEKNRKSGADMDIGSNLVSLFKGDDIVVLACSFATLLATPLSRSLSPPLSLFKYGASTFALTHC